MLQFLLIFGILVAFLTLAIKGLIWWVGKIVGVTVMEKHKAAEAIIQTGRAPEGWVYRTKGRIERSPHNSRKRDRLKEKTKDNCLKKIDKLIRYFETCVLVEDEETRELLLNKLVETRNSWENKNWEM